ncbi:cathepsin O-like isoform X1 [Diachasmimorpha longicaudata]|uniref:cathepsin O-like isoform X1 n=1 Tax=Diachasmimorpha longicaudata TaxID=58733 RepID=UPI0030B89520
MEWKTVAATALVISLGFLAIPIKVAPDTSVEDVRLFETYVSYYNKSYRHDPEEYGRKFGRFQRSLRQIERMNRLRSTQESAYYGLTEFSDLSEEEFLSLALRPDLSARGERHRNDCHRRRTHDPLPERLNRVKRLIDIPPKFDWRTKGVVTPVRAQGSCGACWAYTVVACVESMVAIKNSTLRSFSVQEMIDCAGNGNFGCNGGDICSLLSWLEDNEVPILPESDYPVTGTSGTCLVDRSKTSTVRVGDFTCDSYVDSEEELISTLVNHGPVAAAVNALTWQNYLGGIIQYHCDGAFSMLNHAVQIVGYDRSGPTPFYIVRNSWGPLFGNKGYLYIAIGKNICGIANQVAAVDVII